MRRGAIETGRGWQWGGGQGEEEMERGAMGKGGRWEGAMGRGERGMPGTTEAVAFTDSYKHMECLCGMRLQSFLTNGYFVYPCNAGYPS